MVNTVPVVIPRHGSDSIVFMAEAVLDLDVYDEKFPPPKPPTRYYPGGTSGPAYDDKVYLTKMDEWTTAKTNWMYLQSLKSTEGLEWETVDPNDPSTFKNWIDELKAAYFTMAEITRIITGIHEACGLSQDRIEEAQDAFFAGLQSAREGTPSPSTARLNTPSGEPANAGE